MAFSRKREAVFESLSSFFGVEATKDACPVLSELPGSSFGVALSIPGLCPLSEALLRQIGRLAPCDALVATGGLLLSLSSLLGACVETRDDGMSLRVGVSLTSTAIGVKNTDGDQTFHA